MSAGSSAEAAVRVEGLWKWFGPHEVLRGIDLEVANGEVVVVFGRSGSGKSTLLRCINFLEEPSEGTIEVAGIALQAQLEKYMARGERRSQDASILPH